MADSKTGARLMFLELQHFLRDTVAGLAGVERWKPYVDAGAAPENDLEHSFSMVPWSIIVLELFDQDPPDIAYNKYEVRACAALHDMGEIGVGDTLYRQKNHSRIEQNRVSHLHQILHLFGAITSRVYMLYVAQYGHPAGLRDEGEAAYSYTSNSLGFEFLERTGYLLYAAGEYQASGKNIPLLVQVLRNQLARLEELLDILPAGRRIFTDPVLEWMTDMLRQSSGTHFDNLGKF
jgi:hypothetical protein